MSEPLQPPGQRTRKTPWQQQGNTPDYRFSLANERTFLAWIRTALAFLAGAIAIDQFALTLAPPVIRQGMAIFLSLACALLSWMAYRRWVANELAMRTGKSLPYTRLLWVVAAFVIGIAVILTLLIFMV
ncbi:YidH family protein [Brenneria izbisi]|uniref:DUF202 domain-containing protein n=1 Tax=Brenneria izbisi TaxID=2939450 RepID=A0AA42C2C2_9GAMM|nr:DUF202 domain-containing protein [Brenneria izbisi]MCV9879023.1 DUF202 domain-containing protein [Brenneria izbisi]MCV9882313.1 DUF202 domain-containing protein [Brenneria izbisi]